MDYKLPSGHTAREIPQEEAEELTKDFGAFQELYAEGEFLVRLSPEGWILPSTFLRFSSKIYNLKCHPDSVLILTYNKAGTFWMSEIVWNMIYNRNLDNPEALVSSHKRAPFLDSDLILPHKVLNHGNPFLEDFKTFCPGKRESDGINLQLFEAENGPRIFRSHLPISLFSKDFIDNCKIIYVIRNPKDIVVSYFNHSRQVVTRDYKGTFEKFFDYFLEDKIIYSPFWSHVKAAWALKDHPNVHLTFFEDLKKNAKEEYTKIGNFLNLDLSSSQIDKIIEQTNFKSSKKSNDEDTFFKSNFLKSEFGKAGASFFRKGEVGSWKNVLTPEQLLKIDSWIKKNTEATGMHFD